MNKHRAYWVWYGHNLIDDFIYDGVECSNCHYRPELKEYIKNRPYPPVTLHISSYEITDICPKCKSIMKETNHE